MPPKQCSFIQVFIVPINFDNSSLHVISVSILARQKDCVLVYSIRSTIIMILILYRET